MSVGSSWNPELGFEPRPSHDVVCGLAKLEKLGALETRLGYTECGSKDRQFAAIVFCWKFKREASFVNAAPRARSRRDRLARSKNATKHRRLGVR